ncbi:MAG: flotillin-like FloA family protein [Candidatus Hydrogenedentes bacterium]|nr:flotillin-like FloA family protein [Candidatus Hydrogenedentota bacterium]
MPNLVIAVALFLGSIVAFAIGVMVFTVFGPWLRARAGRAPIAWLRLCTMAMRRVNLGTVVNVYILAKQAGVDASIDEIESHMLAGGNVNRVMVAAAVARRADVSFSFRMAAGFDLSGRDVVSIAQDLVHAKETGLREQAEKANREALAARVGRTAEVVHAIGPPGLVTVDGELVQAVSVGGYLPKGATVEIVGTKDNMVVVKAAAD